MPSRFGWPRPALISRILLILGVAGCLVAMHAVVGVQASVGTRGTATANSIQPAVPMSGVGRRQSSPAGDGSGSGSMSVTAWERCAAIVVVIGLPLLARPVLRTARQVLGRVLPGAAFASGPPDPSISGAPLVLRI